MAAAACASTTTTTNYDAERTNHCHIAPHILLINGSSNPSIPENLFNFLTLSIHALTVQIVAKLANSPGVIDVTHPGVSDSLPLLEIARHECQRRSRRATPGAETYQLRSSSQVVLEGLQLYFGACARACEDTPKSWIDTRLAYSPEVETKGQDYQTVDNGRCVAKR